MPLQLGSLSKRQIRTVGIYTQISDGIGVRLKKGVYGGGGQKNYTFRGISQSCTCAIPS